MLILYLLFFALVPDEIYFHIKNKMKHLLGIHSPALLREMYGDIVLLLCFVAVISFFATILPLQLRKMARRGLWIEILTYLVPLVVLVSCILQLMTQNQ